MIELFSLGGLDWIKSEKTERKFEITIPFCRICFVIERDRGWAVHIRYLRNKRKNGNPQQHKKTLLNACKNNLIIFVELMHKKTVLISWE